MFQSYIVSSDCVESFGELQFYLGSNFRLPLVALGNSKDAPFKLQLEM